VNCRRSRGGTVLADHDHRGGGIVEAVAATGGVAHAAQTVDLGLGPGAGHQPGAELAKGAVAVEHRRAVHLGQGVGERSQVGRAADPQRRRHRQARLTGRERIVVGAVHQQRADAPSTQVVDRELEQLAQHDRVVAVAAGRHGRDPLPHGCLDVPPQPVVSGHAERTGQANDALGVALHQRRPRGGGQHDQVALGARRTVEHDRGVLGVDRPTQPARQPVGEAAGLVDRERSEGPTGHPQLGDRRPLLHGPGRLDHAAVAGHPALVHHRVHRVVDLLQQQRTPVVGTRKVQAHLVELVGQAGDAP
jgi:hypothetical protein